MTDEQRDFEDLLRHPGWVQLVNFELTWWTTQTNTQLELCANDRDDVAALNKLRQLIAAKKAVERFIARPKDRIRQLTSGAISYDAGTGTFQRGGV